MGKKKLAADAVAMVDVGKKKAPTQAAKTADVDAKRPVVWTLIGFQQCIAEVDEIPKLHDIIAIGEDELCVVDVNGNRAEAVFTRPWLGRPGDGNWFVDASHMRIDDLTDDVANELLRRVASNVVPKTVRNEKGTKFGGEKNKRGRREDRSQDDLDAIELLNSLDHTDVDKEMIKRGSKHGKKNLEWQDGDAYDLKRRVYEQGRRAKLKEAELNRQSKKKPKARNTRNGS